MKILQVHNYYQYSGGEDVVLNNELALLNAHGHEVIQFTKSNKEIDNYSFIEKSKLFFGAAYSNKSYNEISELIKRSKPDTCHVHNTMPLISPSVYYACSHNNLPIVQTLHNYRLLCSNAYLFRDGKVCEECIGKSLYNSVKYGCYRDSKLQTFSLARTIEKNRKWSTWNNKIDLYITLTEFAKNKFIEGGLPEDKLKVKPNFLSEDPGINNNTQNHFLFAGRLDITKGLQVIFDAIKSVDESIKILVAGDGPFKSEVQNSSKVKYEGQLANNELIKKLHDSVALIFPSIWYEGMPMLIVEAFACGKPVIASNLGSMAELIQDGKTGLLFELGNAADLAEKINWAYLHKEEMKQMGINAREEYEQKYTAERNYNLLMKIYNEAIENRKVNSR